MEVWATRRTPILSLNVEPLDRWLAPDRLPNLLANADIVVLLASYNQSTQEIIGARELETMRETAILVNLARGRLIDQEALIRALAAHEIGGAILDVVATEPLPAESPLWTMRNVVITPHISANTPASYRRAVDILCVNLPLYLAGARDRMANLVDRNAAR
jgi:phosphoglycerate dehydrogenase-like enzyme